MVPPLEHHCGSWVVVSRADNTAVLETFSRSVAEKINQEKYRVLTTLQWLASLNQKEGK